MSSSQDLPLSPSTTPRNSPPLPSLTPPSPPPPPPFSERASSPALSSSPASPPPVARAIFTRELAMCKASKRWRAPVSIFEIPYPPTAAQPGTTAGFFEHLESVERTVQEEDVTDIPKDLEQGPLILVESLNKKRVRARPEDLLPPSPPRHPPLKKVQFALENDASFPIKTRRSTATTASSSSSSPVSPLSSTSSRRAKSTRISKKIGQKTLDYDEPPQDELAAHRRAVNLSTAVNNLAWGDDDSADDEWSSPEVPDNDHSLAAPVLGGRRPFPDDKADLAAEHPDQHRRLSEGGDDQYDHSDHINESIRSSTLDPGSANATDTSASVLTPIDNPTDTLAPVMTPPSTSSRLSTVPTDSDLHALYANTTATTHDKATDNAGTTTTVSSGRSKKGKEPVRTVASVIGSRRKHPSESTSAPLRSTHLVSSGPSVVALDENVDDDTVVEVGPSHRLSQRRSERVRLSSTPAEDKTRTLEAPLTPQAPRPLASIKVYTIPVNMDSMVFKTMRARVLELGGAWLGPKTKVLQADPRVKQEVPVLDNDITTHIVTALSSVDAVKRFLKVDEINPKIAIVGREWLSDTIMYKRPMESQTYAIGKIALTDVAAPATADVEPSTPSPDTAKASTMNQNQLSFHEIMQGIQEGSLDDGDISDAPENDAVDVSHEDPSHEIAAPESGENKPRGLSADEVGRLRREKRCFLCKEVGHWMKNCPKQSHGTTKDEVLLQIISSGKSEGSRRKSLYQCQSPHVAGGKDEPRYNGAILEQLKILMDHYDKVKTKGSKEHFKVINYRKAITAIRALDYEITSEEMALKVPRVGKKIAQKIGECVALGKIKKLDHLDWDKERSRVETLFRSVYGVGSEMATEWYNKGCRTLDDLRKLPDLTKNQITGLKYHEDLLKRIPRQEVEQIGRIVESAAKSLHPDIDSQVTGSYRRGKFDCGDVDIVVARPNIDNGDELFVIMEHILKELVKADFLVEHLSLPVWSESMANQTHHFKYMGICKLPGDDSVHRHIDILVVPWIHLGAVLIYFTGNDICNRSMRLFASNRGMRLSDKGLFEGVIRSKARKRVNEGRWVAGRTEREIFDYLKIPYLEPYEREC
ncbi:hypothetical protein BGZ98_005670 [Dissophora globulifera]|nr:hypothetical protein BGZ98_005670 [Dissophora globulifera]